MVTVPLSLHSHRDTSRDLCLSAFIVRAYLTFCFGLLFDKIMGSNC